MDSTQYHNNLVSSGFAHTLVSTSAGGIFSFGSSRYGQLGNGSEMNVDSPQEIGVGHPNTGTYQKLPLLADERIVHVSCGYHHSAAVSSRGVLYSWGRDSEGCLGHGVEEMNAGEWSNDMRSTFLPSAVRSFLQQEKKTMRVRVRIENVSCGSEHSLAVDNHQIFSDLSGEELKAPRRTCVRSCNVPGTVAPPPEQLINVQDHRRQPR